MGNILDTLSYFLSLFADLFQVVGGLWVFYLLVKTYFERPRAVSSVKREPSAELDEYAVFLEKHGEPESQSAFFRIMALKSLLSIKNENHAHHLVIRLFFAGIFALGMYIVSKLTGSPDTWIRIIVRLVLMIEAVAAFLMAAVFGAIFDSRIEKSSAKLTSFIETASKKLIEEQSKSVD